jgi:hypothetical protein
VKCLECGGKVELLGGVICANIGLQRGQGLAICDGAWHGACFKQHEMDKFPVLGVRDLDDALVNEDLLEDEDLLRFKEAREGDHLICLFQCDYCHFDNMKKRRPIIGNLYDQLCLICIRRVILDSLWGRERTTVNSNKLEGLRYIGVCRALGSEEDAYPAQGPFPRKDLWGMRAACDILIRSVDRGKNSATIQFETMRKMRSHLANFTHTCPGGDRRSFHGRRRCGRCGV